MKIKSYHTFLLLLLPAALFSQNTFEFWLEYPVRKWSNHAIEREDGSFIAVISERSGTNYAPSEPTKAYLLLISPNGDTATRHYHFHDTTFNFNGIFKSYNEGYLITGFAKLPDTDELHLLLMEVDVNLDPVWIKFHDFSDYYIVGTRRVFMLNGNYLLAGGLCNFPCSSIIPLLMYFDQSGDVVSHYIHPDISTGESEYMLNSDSTRIWLFSPGLHGNGGWPSLAVFDMTPTFLYHQFIQFGSTIITTIWHTDSTYLLSGIENRPGVPYQDDELWILSYDTMHTIGLSNHFGAPDTLDYPAFSYAIDLNHPDTVFFAGFKHVRLGLPPPGRVSWIMTGQTDALLQERYLHFIGGDGYYETHYILATQDGGSFICAAKLDHDTKIYNLVFLKLNSEGLLTGFEGAKTQIRKTMIWPNPFSDHLQYRTLISGTELILFDISGRQALKTIINNTAGSIAVGSLKPGVYFYQLHYADGRVEMGKLVKI